MASRKELTEAALAADKKLLAKLESSVLNFQDSDDWLRVLEWQANYPSRSINNNILIQIQHPGATLCRGYRQWQKHGRQVEKGETAIGIWAPMTFRRTNEETGEDDGYVRRFKIAYVFDISQTRVFDEELDKANHDPFPVIDGDTHLYGTLLLLCQRQGIDVSFSDTLGLSEGMARWNEKTGERQIVLRDDRSPAHNAQVMLHELAHVFLHQQPDSPDLDTRTKEWEAESCAWILAQHYALETFSDFYLSSWQVQEKGQLMPLLRRISEGAKQIIEIIEAVATVPAQQKEAA